MVVDCGNNLLAYGVTLDTPHLKKREVSALNQTH